MTNRTIAVPLAGFVLLAASSARAQDASAQTRSEPSVEITPYAFMGSGSSCGVGTAVRWPLATTPFSLELETNYRRAEMGALSANLSLLFDLPRAGAVTPYLAGGVGLDQYGTPEVRGGSVLTRERTAFSVNAGGGVRVQSDGNWGARADARWFKDVGREGPERWRLYNGVTIDTSKK